MQTVLPENVAPTPDSTALGLRSPRIELCVPARRSYLAMIQEVTQAFLSRWMDPAGESGLEILLAVQEACTNVVRHAYKGRTAGDLQYRMEVDHDVLRIFISDDGCGFDPSRIPAPDPQCPLEGGYGLYLMGQLVSKVTYSREGSRNTTILEKSLLGRCKDSLE